MLKENVKVEDGYLVLDCAYAEFYIPKKYMEDEMAVDNGESFKSLGIFYIRTFSAPDKPNALEVLKLPGMVYMYPNEKEWEKLTIGADYEDDYLVLKFYKGDKIMQAAVKCDSAMPEYFLNCLLTGRIPRNIPYDKVLELFIKVFTMNKVGIPVPILILEMIISEVYRYSGDHSLKYGQYLANNFNHNKKQLEYFMANVRTICKANSSFAGVSFENIDEMFTSAINNNKYNRKETKTPFEEVIKY